MISIYEEIERLLQFGLKKNLIEREDLIFTRNTLLDVLQVSEWQDVTVKEEDLHSPDEILDHILKWVEENGTLKDSTVTYRDLLDTKIMGCLTPKPSEVIRIFELHYKQEGAEAATKYLYDLSKYVHYIRTDRISKNKQWFVESKYGNLEMTINLSKPEKDPKEIAEARKMKKSSYPKCLLCKENVGYAGRVNHPARQNLRTVPVRLGEETWHLQFSPYVYYHEHAILFLDEHVPMKISKRTFRNLLEFVEKFPHYFLGSNADLPIVGGSILSHDHFQGGNHDFPMAKAEIEERYVINDYPNVKVGIVNWPMSVLRLQGKERMELEHLADRILQVWKNYSDECVDIIAYTDERSHNTITPIARKRGELYELDLVLRNNRTSEQHPHGIFHPHEDVHHIKKENIGLIEVMGLAVLPGRLKEEIEVLSGALLKENFEQEIEHHDMISKHLNWSKIIKEKYPTLSESNCKDILLEEIGQTFSTILEHAGVFKRDLEGKKAFKKFLRAINEHVKSEEQ